MGQVEESLNLVKWTKQLACTTLGSQQEWPGQMKRMAKEWQWIILDKILTTGVRSVVNSGENAKD